MNNNEIIKLLIKYLEEEQEGVQIAAIGQFSEGEFFFTNYFYFTEKQQEEFSLQYDKEIILKVIDSDYLDEVYKPDIYDKSLAMSLHIFFKKHNLTLETISQDRSRALGIRLYFKDYSWEEVYY